MNRNYNNRQPQEETTWKDFLYHMFILIASIFIIYWSLIMMAGRCCKYDNCYKYSLDTYCLKHRKLIAAQKRSKEILQEAEYTLHGNPNEKRREERTKRETELKKQLLENKKKASKSSSSGSYGSGSYSNNKSYDPIDYGSPEAYADDAWGTDYDDWDDAYEAWEDEN